MNSHPFLQGFQLIHAFTKSPMILHAIAHNLRALHLSSQKACPSTYLYIYILISIKKKDIKHKSLSMKEKRFHSRKSSNDLPPKTNKCPGGQPLSRPAVQAITGCLRFCDGQVWQQNTAETFEDVGKL